MNLFQHWSRGTVLALLFAASSSSSATQFKLVALDLGSGYTMSGTVDTDGTVGQLSAANIVSWKIDVTSSTGYSFTPATTHDISWSVVSDGSRLVVPTSPDGWSDGGLLGFYGGVYNQVRVADFTGAYVTGGTSLYIKGSAFEFLDLGQPDGIQYVAADVDPLLANVYRLRPLTFLSGAKLRGTVKTDGTIGLTRFLDWNITVTEESTFTFTPSNSRILMATGVWTDGHSLKVTPIDPFGNGNGFEIGFGSIDYTMAVLADFTWLPEGQAGYVSPFGMFTVSPLPLNIDGDYVVGTASGTEHLSPIAERIVLGSGKSGTLSSWSSVDGDVRKVCKFFVPTMTSPAVRIDLDFQSTKTAPTAIGLVWTARAVNAGAYSLRLLLWNKTAAKYDTVKGDTPLTTSFADYLGQASGVLADYVATGGLVTARTEIRQTGPGAAMLPCFEFDRAQLDVTD